MKANFKTIQISENILVDNIISIHADYMSGYIIYDYKSINIENIIFNKLNIKIYKINIIIDINDGVYVGLILMDEFRENIFDEVFHIEVSEEELNKLLQIAQNSIRRI